MKFHEFKNCVGQKGLTAIDHGGGHWQVMGNGKLVNWYPFSKKTTLYNATDKKTIMFARLQDVLEEFETIKKQDRIQLRAIKKIMHRKNNACYLCQKVLTLDESTVDHVIPLDKGGTNYIDNLRIACLDCNRDKANHIVFAPSNNFFLKIKNYVKTKLTRRTSMNKVYVGNLAWTATEQDLEKEFSQFGKVTDVKVVYDRETNRSKGFGFVTFATSNEADAAVEGMFGKEMGGRGVKVSIAVDRPRERTDRGGGRTDRRENNRY